MGSQYYLVSQLPSLENYEGRGQLPLTEKSFKELCSRFLSKKDCKILEKLSLEPPKSDAKTGSALLDKWNEKERNLRFALAQIRALKMKKESEMIAGSISADVMQAARTAVGMDSPLAAEEYLNQYRMETLKNLTPLDNFSLDAVFAYGLKLMLAERMKLFDAEIGKDSYHKIYDEILGDAK